MSKSLAMVAILAGLAAGAAAQESFLFTREVQIPAAGAARVPLDLGALRQMAPGAAGLRVLGPDGREVAFRLIPSVPGSRRRPAQILETRREGGSWVLVLDAGVEAASHERLFLEAVRSGRPPAAVLEGSPDQDVWQTLAETELSRIGEAGGLQRLSISYPSTADRYLRLRWPSPAGEGQAPPPKISAAEVETLAGPTLTFSARGAVCDRAEASIACTLELPAAGQVLRRLTFEIAGTGSVGYRLYRPRDGGWSPLAEGVFQRSGDRSSHFLAGGPERIAGTSLLLELYGSGAAPRLGSYGVDLAVPTVAFEAALPGRHTLAYGRPPLPSAPGAPLGRIRFAAGWSIAAPSAKPGDLVRLELPDAVYAAARSDLGDLRVAVAGRQIPFFRWRPAVPARAARESMRPRDTGQAGESQVVVSLPVAGLPLTEIHLTAPGLPLRRPVSVRYIAPDRFNRPEARERVDWETWECTPEPPLPCRERLPLSAREGRAPRLLAVRFDDADNPPLPKVDATVWRRRDVLLFVWPQPEEEESGGTPQVRLLAGSRDLKAASYDFASLGEALLGYPWRAAEVDVAGAAAAEAPRWNRWVMPAALALATACLLLLLRRILSEPESET